MSNENSQTYKLIKSLNSISGVRAKKRHGGRFQQGEPDIAGVYVGQSFFIEVKTSTGTLSQLQAEELDRWQKVGAITAVAVHGTAELRGKPAFRVVTLNPWGIAAGTMKGLTGGDVLGFEAGEWKSWLDKALS